jgi:hypothetical protein
MKLILREVSDWQWIMLAATIAIGFFMFMANNAQAYYAGGHPAATTLSHCGWLPLPAERHYHHTQRNVRIIQGKLEHTGYSVGKTGVDGLYGNRTKGAVKQFQTQYHLPSDGHVNGTTASMLAYVTHPIAQVRRCQRQAIWR